MAAEINHDWRHYARVASLIGMGVLAVLLLFERTMRAEEMQYQDAPRRQTLYVRPAQNDTAMQVAVLQQQVDQNTANIQNVWRTLADHNQKEEDRDREQEKALNRIEGGGGAFLLLLSVLQALGLTKKKGSS